MRIRIHGAVAVMAIMCAACSSSAPAQLDLGPDPVSTEATTTTVAPTTTIVSATTSTANTEPPPTTVVPTTPPIASVDGHPGTATTTTTPPPTTTQPAVNADDPLPPDLTADEMKAAMDLVADTDARLTCAYDPAGCDFAGIAVPGSPMDNDTRALMKSRVDNNLRSVSGHGGVRLRVEKVSLSGGNAFVTTCALNTVVVYDIQDPNNPNDDIVFDDSTQSGRVQWELQIVDGQWRIYDGTQLSELEGGDLCAFS